MPSVLIFAIQICFFGAAALYLHYRSEDYGLSPLLFFVAGIMGVLNIIELMTLYVEPVPGIVIRPGGHVYVPIILLIVLIIYITSGTRTAQITIAGLIGVDVLILCVLTFLLLYLNVRDSSTSIQGLLTEEQILTPLFLRGVLASTIAFTADMFVITIVYQGIQNALPSCPRGLVPGVALLVALWVDSTLFNILSFVGTSHFVLEIPGDILMKTLAGLLLSVMAGWYLVRIAPNLTQYRGAANRSTFDILFGEGRITSRVAKLESELQVSRAIYEQLVSHIEEVFWLVDIEQKRLLYLSPNFEKITGKPAKMFYKNPDALIDLVHPEDRTEGFFRQLLLSPETEFCIEREDGGICWLRNRSFPIVTVDGQVVRYAGITEDVTERKEAQAKTFALELSREKVRLLHQFINDASHDLRTPLSIIMLKVHQIEKASTPRRKTLLDELHQAAIRLSDLIDDLFTLSRIEGGEQIRPERIDLNEIAQQVCDNHQIIVEAKGLSLVVHPAGEVIPVTGSRDQLCRLTANLVENAIHYTEQGTINVKTLVEDDQAVLEVADTGIGIAQDHIDSIFERFYRTEQAREIRRDGTGLGLAISKAIVDQHRGTISVQSAPGEGTTIRVTLPIERSGGDQAGGE
ncbi:MAG: PAS domain-containing sensor histidine kinase [Anaerolineae bacterium]|nr:PAS domain-containing sensor histidine kinase [Anaerolineae bacterium]